MVGTDYLYCFEIILERVDTIVFQLLALVLSIFAGHFGGTFTAADSVGGPPTSRLIAPADSIGGPLTSPVVTPADSIGGPLTAPAVTSADSIGGPPGSLFSSADSIGGPLT